MMSRYLIGLALTLAACHGHTKPEAPVSQTKMWKQFSGANAFGHVQELVNFGPRPPESDGIEKARAYLTNQLEGLGWHVIPQEFTDETPRGKITFVNMLATFSTDGSTPTPSFLLCSHYDTKFFSTVRFVGANDGGSSTGLLIELARVLSLHPEMARKVELVFFDGEEAYVSFTATDGLYGSRYFAKSLGDSGKVKQFHGGLLFDMIGDSTLTVTLPPDSPSTMALGIFDAADVLKVRSHFTYAQSGITDDHTPLNAIGIPVVDLIDFNYPPWHTPEDTMDKLSAESLDIVGGVAAWYLSEVALK